jgi:hypothetical protein
MFGEIHEKAINCKNAATLQNIKLEADALKIRLLNEMDKKDLQVAEDKSKEEDGNEVKEKRVPIKKKRNISFNKISVTKTWRIESTQDLDRYMSDLREKILNELDQDTIINVEF